MTVHADIRDSPARADQPITSGRNIAGRDVEEGTQGARPMSGLLPMAGTRNNPKFGRYSRIRTGVTSGTVPRSALADPSEAASRVSGRLDLNQLPFDPQVDAALIVIGESQGRRAIREGEIGAKADELKRELEAAQV